MALSPDGRLLYAGNLAGEIVTVDVSTFTIRDRIRAHDGAVQAIAVHRTLPYVAALGSDRALTIWRRETAGLRRLGYVSLRQFRATNDVEEVEPVHSTSQAIAFHDADRRLVTRTANSALVELEFDDIGNIDELYCVRMHGDADLTSVRYVAGEDSVLSGSIHGDFVHSRSGELVRRWQLDHRSNIHWAEQLRGREYILATDRRNLVRIDLDEESPLAVGPVFTRDDLEHVTINRDTGSTYCASFDRTIYRVDPDACSPLEPAFRAPFKCRWIRAFGSGPEILLVQCRNGALYKVNADEGSIIKEIKETPDAVWTATHQSGALWFAGDGAELIKLESGNPLPADDRPTYRPVRFHVPGGEQTYVKRMVTCGAAALALGRTDGTIVLLDLALPAPSVRASVDVGSAVRDIAVNDVSGDLYAACEDSSVRCLDGRSMRQKAIWHGDPLEPIWSVACSPNSEIVAAAERGGRVALLRASDLTPTSYSIPTGRPKRMKFSGPSELLFVNRDQLDVLDLVSGLASTRISPRGNTIEDFIWDHQRRYLITVGYTQTIGLFDFASGQELSQVPDQIDYSKGLVWAVAQESPAARQLPLDFITFGRSGRFHLFRIHDEKILSLGEVSAPAQAAAAAADRSAVLAA